jgi:hypothetical protein
MSLNRRSLLFQRLVSTRQKKDFHKPGVQIHAFYPWYVGAIARVDALMNRASAFNTYFKNANEVEVVATAVLLTADGSADDAVVDA